MAVYDALEKLGLGLRLLLAGILFINVGVCGLSLWQMWVHKVGHPAEILMRVVLDKTAMYHTMFGR